jgi:integrase
MSDSGIATVPFILIVFADGDVMRSVAQDRAGLAKQAPGFYRAKGNHLKKRAIKNGRMIRVELPREVLRALEMVPHPKAAPSDSTFFFKGGKLTSVRSLVKGAQRTLAAVFRIAKVEHAHPHRFRHTLASELLGKGATVEEVAGILADSPATIRRHYAKWTPEFQALQDRVIRLVHGTNLAQAEEHVSKCALKHSFAAAGTVPLPLPL